MAASRVFLLLIAGLTLSSCGDSGTEPDPDGPRITISAGDGQEGEPGADLPVHPAVMVRDKAGHGMAGVTVTFAVDSGGGFIADAVATTDAAGTAVAGTWTLGPGEGRNVLRVSAKDAESAFLHARAAFAPLTLLDSVPVGTEGGALSVLAPGDPMNGLTIVIPSGAYPTATRWSVKATRGMRPSLPSNAVQVGQTLLIGNGHGYADEVMRVTIPARVGADSALAAFFLDPETGSLELVPTLARTDTSLTIMTRHFSAASLLRPVGASPLRARFGSALRHEPEFGWMPIVLVAMDLDDLARPVTTGFLPGVDDWEFPNYGSYLEPRGQCAGQSITAMYYFYRHRATAGALFHRFDDVTTLWQDNPRGIRLASVAQHAIRWDEMWQKVNDTEELSQQPGFEPPQIRYQSLIMAMMLTLRPQFVSLSGVDMGGNPLGHAVVAYEAADGAVSFADPNKPGDRTQRFDFTGGQFHPYAIPAIAGGIAIIMANATPIGVSAMLDLASLDGQWSDFEAGTIGNAEFPEMLDEAWNPFSHQWEPLTGNLLTSATELLVRSRCPACPVQRGGVDGDRQGVVLYEVGGAPIASDQAEGLTGATIPLSAGDRRLGFTTVAIAQGGTPPTWGYANFRWLDITMAPFTVSPTAVTTPVDSTVRFDGHADGLATEASTWAWNFDDGTAGISGPGRSTVNHVFRTAGHYTVAVDLRDAGGRAIGHATADVTVGATGPTSVWRVTEASLGDVAGDTPPTTAPNLGLKPVLDAYYREHDGWAAVAAGTQSASLWFLTRTDTIGSTPSKIYAAGLYQAFALPGAAGSEPTLSMLIRSTNPSPGAIDDLAFSWDYTLLNEPPDDGIVTGVSPDVSSTLALCLAETQPPRVVVHPVAATLEMHGEEAEGSITYTYRLPNSVCAPYPAPGPKWSFRVNVKAVRVR
jgi:hypothetical protein